MNRIERRRTTVTGACEVPPFYTAVRLVLLALRLLCASAALDLQVDRANVRLRDAGRPERHAFAVAAGVVPALLVHYLDLSRQGAGRPERHAFAVAADVVPAALLVHRLDVRLQGALCPDGDAGAVGARVLPLLVGSSQ